MARDTGGGADVGHTAAQAPASGAQNRFLVKLTLISVLAVIVAANIWALAEPPQTEAQRSLSRAIEEILGAENTTREGPPDAPSRYRQEP